MTTLRRVSPRDDLRLQYFLNSQRSLMHIATFAQTFANGTSSTTQLSLRPLPFLFASLLAGLFFRAGTRIYWIINDILLRGC